jgi:dephospho-CoA kinase
MTTIIGLTGFFGSGCTYIGKEFIVDMGYEYLSLSTILKKDFMVDHSHEPSRQELEDYGNKKREEEDSDILANEIIKIIKDKNFDKCIVDSIRNPHEIEYLKDSFSEFYLCSVFGDYQVRWDRVKSPDKYDGDQKMFNSDDERDRDEELDYGQRVRDCCDRADIIISNNKDVHKGGDDYKYLKSKVEHYVELIEHKSKFEPTNDETLMAMAYANSFRSHCLKRKVGAIIIIDNYGNVFSSGLNNI